MILASIATVLLGAAVGWRPSGVIDHERRKETSVSSRASMPLEKEVRQEWSALGVGWRAWARRVETAATQEELEELYSDLIAALDQNLQITVGKLIGARYI